MTSLREEIVKILVGRYPHYFINKDVDEIISVFEKRIDELRKDRPADLYRAYNAALDDVMEEVLK